MTTLKIIVASTRPGRIGPSIGAWIQATATSDGSFDSVELMDLAVLDLPFMNEPNHPRLGQYTQVHTLGWSAWVDSADAFIFVMPEYNYGYNAELKNAIDYLHREWSYKPVGLVSYGGVSGGTRAAQMIKQVVTTLRMMPLAEAVAIPFAAQYRDESGTFNATDQLERSAMAMLSELARTSEAMRVLRQIATPA